MAKDNADIRYLVLSSLVSGELLQVEASLFAGGCFSEISNDFPIVLLEILVNLVTSSDASTTVKVAAARAFSKMVCSCSNACKAYQAGLKLVLGSSEEVFSIAMLISLSQLALKSTWLIPEQVRLLFSSLTEDKSLGLRVVALKCLHYVTASGGMCHFPAHPLFIQSLVDLSNESESPPSLQCGALQLLRKVVLYNLSTEAYEDIFEFSKLYKIIQTALHSPIIAKRHISIRFLIGILSELSASKANALGGVDFITLASEAMTIIFDEVYLLVELVFDNKKSHLEIEQKIKNLLSLLLVLVESFPHLGIMVLERICSFTENMVNKNDKDVEMVEATVRDGKCIEKTKLLSYVSKISSSVLENLNKAGIINKKVLDCIELMVKEVFQSNSFDCYAHVAFSLSLHSRITNLRVSNPSEKNEIFYLECEEMVLATRDNWSAYKLGKIAACHGEWSTAAFIFEHLVRTVKSDKYKLWFKSLIKFAHSEKILQFLELPNGCATSSSSSEIKIENIVEASKSIRSSEETMTAIVESDCAVIFSRWFLDLRAKVLESVVDTLRLCSLPLSEDKFESLICDFAQISSRFCRLSREFDIMATSFMGMDKESLEIISENALKCSLLAFATGFSLFFPHFWNINFTKTSEECLQGRVILDLAWRLQHRDYKISAKLGFLLKVCQRPKSSLMYYTNQIYGNGVDEIGLLSACEYATSEMVTLQNEANEVNDHDENLFCVSEKGLRIVLDIISKCMLIPFRAPTHFFHTRPCISSEIIVSNSDTTTSSKKISVSQGSQLNLDLCIQLKNAPSSIQFQSIKLYCILYCKKSFQVHKDASYKKFGGDDMAYANERLFGYIKGSSKKATNDGFIETFVRFELNEKGQGFSSCLLDVTGFSLGSYRTRWLSCCVDSEGSYWNLISSNESPVFTVVGSDWDCRYEKVYSRRLKN